MSHTTTAKTQISPILSLSSKWGKLGSSSPLRPIGTQQELYNWTFTADAVAPCFIKDIHEMKDCEALDQEFFWLGRIPCRVAKIVGLVVGVQQWEAVTRFTVDDGSAVIECVHRHIAPPSTPVKGPMAKYRAPKKKSTLVDAPPPPPIASVGDSIAVKGRVCNMRHTRCLKVNDGDIVLCSSANDEMRHWQTVLDLHRNSYFLEEPFLIPPLNRRSATQAQLPSSSPVSLHIPSSPSISTSSPFKRSTRSPPRLRHPSRLHSRDLTEITFRIYLKHFMDNASTYVHHRRFALTPRLLRTPPGSDDECRDPVTPTPKERRWGTSRTTSTATTPRSRTFYAGETVAQKSSDLHSDFEPEFGLNDYGFTLGYLRRVPVLADMARRVVRAERKRREREARKRAKENVKAAPLSAPVMMNKAKESTSRKMKRLFVKAIRDLYTEGSIVIWDGPVRKLTYPAEGLSGNLDVNGTSRLWKSTVHTMNTSLASLASSTLTVDDDDSGQEMSDEVSTEEAYLPVTTRRVAALVLDAISALAARAARRPTKPKPVSQSKMTRPAKVEEPTSSADGRPTLATVHDIAAYIRGTDQRWANLGDWAVDAALDELLHDERVYRAGNERWGICL